MKFRQEFSSSASRAATQKDLALTCKHISWNELKPHRNISKHYDLMTCHVMWMFALKNRKGLTTQVIDQADQGPNFSPMLCSCCSLSTFSKSGKGMLCFCKWTWKIWKTYENTIELEDFPACHFWLEGTPICQHIDQGYPENMDCTTLNMNQNHERRWRSYRKCPRWSFSRVDRYLQIYTNLTSALFPNRKTM